jgi:hypothetical protein
LGYTAAATVRYAFGEIERILATILDESLHVLAQQAFGRPIGEILDYWAQVACFADSLTDEALELMEKLG